MAGLAKSACQGFNFYSGYESSHFVSFHSEQQHVSVQIMMLAPEARAFAQELLLHADVAEGKEGAREALAAAHAPPVETTADVPPETPPDADAIFEAWRTQVDYPAADPKHLRELFDAGKTPGEAFDELMPF